ncbi:MAG: uroporphyrinogen decarboxylase family protein [Armatimonadota bacterium]
MSEAMTSRERLINALEGRPVDRIPYSPFLVYMWEHLPQAIQEMGQEAFLREVGADPLWRGTACPVVTKIDGIEARSTQDGLLNRLEIMTPVGTLRCAWHTSETGNTGFLIEHPLKTEADFLTQLWLEEHTEITWNDQHVIAAEVERDGLALGILIPRGKSAFQCMVEALVGTEELVYALADYPETVRALYDAMVATDLRAARLAAESAYTYFLTWEDSSTQNYSPALYDEFIAPEIRQWCAILADSGKRYIQHACGHVKDLIAPMKRDGVFAVESISTPPTGNVSLREVRQIAGNSFGIVGGIEPTHFLQLSPEELVPYVEGVIADCGGGPFILGNSDSCPPGVTMEKFKLVGEIVRRARV